MKEVKTYEGQKLKISGQSYAEYVEWRDALIRQIGQDLADNLPKFFGRVEFNIQNGKFVNANIVQGIK
jgi:hypothetical protein